MWLLLSSSLRPLFPTLAIGVVRNVQAVGKQNNIEVCRICGTGQLDAKHNCDSFFYNRLFVALGWSTLRAEYLPFESVSLNPAIVHWRASASFDQIALYLATGSEGFCDISAGGNYPLFAVRDIKQYVACLAFVFTIYHARENMEHGAEAIA